MNYLWTDGHRICAELRMTELRDQAARARLVRAAPGYQTLRQRVGGALITTGERLSR